MEINEVIKRMSEIKGGTMVRVVYRTEMPVKAKMKPEVKIIKTTEVTMRIGVDYDNISSVIERRSNSESTRKCENNYTWIVENRVCVNSKTGCTYARFTTVPNHGNPHITYTIEKVTETYETEELTDEEKSWVRDSYWTGKESEVRNVKIENIVCIGK